MFACVLRIATAGSVAEPQRVTAYRVEPAPRNLAALTRSYSSEQLGILEKLNRADRNHLGRLPSIVVPEEWTSDELAYSVLPLTYPSADHLPKLLVVFIPGQIFGAYEWGTLVYWGPVNTGARASQTPAGLFSLNWKSLGHTSTVDPDWFMPWYFNFSNRQGLAFHQYSLPGRPASHGCIRLLERDAIWLYNWGEPWQLDASRTRVLRPGTPVFIVGSYDFASDPPWRSPEWQAGTIELPPFPDNDG